jgi:putative transposase
MEQFFLRNGRKHSGTSSSRKGVSIRRACEALRFDTSSHHYKSRRARCPAAICPQTMRGGRGAGLELRIKEICETRVCYGYRRVHVLLRREGWRVNIKKARRIYNELGRQLRIKCPKRRVKAKLRDDRAEAVGPKDAWAMRCPVLSAILPKATPPTPPVDRAPRH